MINDHSGCLTQYSIFLVFISYDYGDTFIDKTESFRLEKNNTTINSTVDLFVTHPKFNTVSLINQIYFKEYKINESGIFLDRFYRHEKQRNFYFR